MPGSGEGIKFYLVPDIDKIIENGIGNVVFAALSQAFFTLSLGVGAMLIFGSYLDKDQKLIGEAVSVTSLDTFVALTAGLIVIPACFSFGIQPDSGPNLIFVTLPNIFAVSLQQRLVRLEQRKERCHSSAPHGSSEYAVRPWIQSAFRHSASGAGEYDNGSGGLHRV